MDSATRLLTFLADAIVNTGDWLRGLLGTTVGLDPSLVSAIMTVISAAVVAFFPLGVVVFFLWAFRKLLARIQGRIGPNNSGTWAGPYAVFQTFADAIKMLTKEDIRPQGVDVVPYNLAPLLVLVAALAVWAVIPFGPELIGSDLGIGIFYIMAFSSAALVVFLMAGWSSNNKYATVGAFRAVAQLIGYEIPQLLSVLAVVMVSGSLSMQEIVGRQDVIFLVALPLPALVFFLSSMAEINARPFELMEAESELVAGFQIEYSGMKWGMFYLSEFMNAVAVAAIFSVLFLGGWRGPWVDVAPILGTVWFMLKIGLMLMVWIFFQFTLPRFRIDQMLAFNWKFLVPLSLANVCVVGLVDRTVTEVFGGRAVPAWTWAGVLLGANVVVAVALWGVLALAERHTRRREGAWRAAQTGESEVGA
jgi:NADH-quinone oxidoreductase subunit H